MRDLAESPVRSITLAHISAQDVLQSNAAVPFSIRSGWRELQQSCESLRRACAHLSQGTQPSKKSTNIGDVKRYLQNVRLAQDGLAIVERPAPLSKKTELIVVPRQYLHGLLECLHIKLNHPSKTELKKVFNRAYYALDVENTLASMTCHKCSALSNMPNNFLEQESTSSPTTIGSMFAADIVRRNGQFILLIREYVSSYTECRVRSRRENRSDA